MLENLQPSHERQKPRLVTINDKLWGVLLQLKGEELSISEYLRKLIEDKWREQNEF